MNPYEEILGTAFESLHAQVRRAHRAPLRAEGTIDVEHRRGWWAGRLIRLMNLPAAGAGQAVRLEVVDGDSDVTWMRRIGASVLRTRQRAHGGRLMERSGIGCVSFELAAHEGALEYRRSSMHVGGLRVPSLVSPRVGAMVSGTANGWHVEVTVTWRGRMLCRYAGKIREA